MPLNVITVNFFMDIGFKFKFNMRPIKSDHTTFVDNCCASVCPGWRNTGGEASDRGAGFRLGEMLVRSAAMN